MGKDSGETGYGGDEAVERQCRAMKKGKKGVFSIVKAVKANARAQVGTPPPEKVLPDPKAKAAAKPRHKETLADLLEMRVDER